MGSCDVVIRRSESLLILQLLSHFTGQVIQLKRLIRALIKLLSCESHQRFREVLSNERSVSVQKVDDLLWRLASFDESKNELGFRLYRLRVLSLNGRADDAQQKCRAD